MVPRMVSLAEGLALKQMRPLDGAVVLRQELLGGGAGVEDLHVFPHHLVQGHEVAAVLHAADDIVAAGLEGADLGGHLGHGGVGGEELLVGEVEPGGGVVGHLAEGQQSVLGAGLAVADVTLLVQPVPEGAGVQLGGVIGPGVAHEHSDGGDQAARPAEGVQVAQGGVAPGGVALAPGGVVSAVVGAVIHSRPGGSGQRGRQQGEEHHQGQESGEDTSVFLHVRMPPLRGCGVFA